MAGGAKCVPSEAVSIRTYVERGYRFRGHTLWPLGRSWRASRARKGRSDDRSSTHRPGAKIDMAVRATRGDDAAKSKPPDSPCRLDTSLLQAAQVIWENPSNIRSSVSLFSL
ncbi:hypothetical protein M885DRAFT_530489, partial [Pelagophyceae sp. CCMP2097]